tara:strand:+ start:128 stop:340 length:213 start_codon:yes stop_codon:yes gene_type:complete
MARYKMVNGERIQFTADEEILRDKEEQKSAIRVQAKKEKNENYLAKRLSGKKKLKDLGLDDDEIKALIGV